MQKTQSLRSTSSKALAKSRRRGLPRLLGQLYGTTTLTDCLAAARFLVQPDELIQGPAIAEFEEAFAQQIGVRHAISFSTARVAFYEILRALGIGPGDEVLLQVPTHIVMPNMVRHLGARPIYVDCSLDTYNMDLSQVEARATPRTRILLIQHTFGIPANMDEVNDLARRLGLIVIEDCVHALGSTYDGRPAGSFGKASVFSMEETKTISSTMGGMAATDDPELAARLREYQARIAWPTPDLIRRYMVKLFIYSLATYPWIHPYVQAAYAYMRKNRALAPGATSPLEALGKVPAGFEQRLSNAQAAIALRQLRRLGENISHRRMIGKRYAARLSEAGFAIPHPPEKSDPAYIRYPVWVKDRPWAIRLAGPSVILGEWFDSILEESASWASGDYPAGSCPRAEAAAEHLVNLPTHPRVTLEDADRFVSILSSDPLLKP